MERIETTILRNLIFNEEYSRKVIPFIQPAYFEKRTEKIIYEEITKFIIKYGSSITIEALNIETENRTDLTEDEVKEVRDINDSLTGVNFFTHEAIFLLSYKNYEPIKIKSSKKIFSKNSVIAS